MNKDQQREFLDSILNHSKHTKDKTYDLKKIFRELNSKINSSTDTNSAFKIDGENPTLDEDGFLNMDLFFDCAKDLGVEPIDFVGYCVNNLQNVGSVSHLGQDIDLSSANDTFHKLQKQFEEYKKSEDINNF